MPKINDYRMYLRNRVRVNRETGCWVYKGKNKDKDGYARLYHNGAQARAHRLSYTLFVREIPEGMSILHSCDVRACINPDHLRVGTQQDNIRDRDSRHRTCKGIAHPKARHTDDEVIAAIRRWWAGETLSEIGDDIGANLATVSRWCRGDARQSCRESALLLENP